MPITVNGFDGNPFDQRSVESLQGRFIVAHYRLALTGSYVAGGDTLDFTNGGVNSAVPPLARVIESIDVRGNAASVSTYTGGGGKPIPIGVPGTTAFNAWKLAFLQASGTDNSSGTYSGISPASPLTDTLELEVTWAR